MVALAIFLTPFLLSFRQAVLNRQVAEQVKLPVTKLSQEQSARYAAFQHRRGAEAPIVVTYRDIRPSRPGQAPRPDTVAPATFSAHLAMLKAAGYSTISADQLAAYLDGEPVPARSVVLAFDGGLQGAWVYVDGLLRRYGFRGMAFVPTGKIGERRSRFLTWAELRRMHASGRWDIQSQGPDAQATVQMTAAGQAAGFYSVRAWLRDKRRRESSLEMRRRIRQALVSSNAAFVRQGLPAPRFLGGIPVHPVVHHESTRLFRAVLVDDELASSVSRRDAVHQTITRLAVRRQTTATLLFRQLAAMAAIDVSTKSPARDPQRWVTDRHRDTRLVFGTDGVRFDSSMPGRLEARYGPQATEDWTDYTVRAEVRGLKPRDSRITAGLFVLDGSSNECEVRVSGARLELFCSTARGELLRRLAIPPRSRHRIEIRTGRHRLEVRVDGLPPLRLRLRASQTVAGGFGLSINRPRADVPAPHFGRLQLFRTREDPGVQPSSDTPQDGRQEPDQLDERGTQAG